MNHLRTSERSCMRLAAFPKKYKSRREKKINAPVIDKENKNRCDKSKKRIAELLFENCIECGRMAAIPQGAFAANKVRRNHECGTLISTMEEKEDTNKQNIYNARPPSEGWELTPLKYNSKLMNSIWGLYNRYSVHNFKKNTDANENTFSAVWEAVQAHPSVVEASVVTSTSTTKTTQFLGTGNGL